MLSFWRLNTHPFSWVCEFLCFGYLMDTKVILMINAFIFPVVLQILALTNLPPPPLLVRWGVRCV